MSQFSTQLVNTIFDAQFNSFDDNYDFYRFGEPKLERENLLKKISSKTGKVLKKLKLYARRYLNRPNVHVLAQWLDHLQGLEWMYSKLEDEDSKELLIQLIAYRIMGYKAIKLPLNTPEYWKNLKEFESLREDAQPLSLGFMDWYLYLHNAEPISFPLRLYCRSLMTQFWLQQYACPRGGVVFEQGQVILDGGGCWGDTALNFAYQVGSNGKVYTFEFVPSNLKILQKNLDLNPDYKQRIEVAEYPLWSQSDLTMYVSDCGPASRVGFDPSGTSEDYTVKTISIDDFVIQKHLATVSLIKMDIEGAEFEALKGAKETLLRFKPNLALSVYHRPEHFYQLAQFIDSLNLGYRFYLGHFTIHQEETVLFAKAD